MSDRLSPMACEGETEKEVAKGCLVLGRVALAIMTLALLSLPVEALRRSLLKDGYSELSALLTAIACIGGLIGFLWLNNYLENRKSQHAEEPESG